MLTGNISPSINLSEKKEKGVGSVFFQWVINAGKIIIIIVELLALAALGYRFIVDRQLADLHDKIKNQQLFVSGQAPKEALYRNLQKRLTVISSISEISQGKIDFIKTLVSTLNSGQFSSTNLTVTNNLIGIDGKTTSIFNLNTLIDQIKKNPDVTNISIDSLASVDLGIQFKLNVTILEKESAI